MLTSNNLSSVKEASVNESVTHSIDIGKAIISEAFWENVSINYSSISKTYTFEMNNYNPSKTG